MHFTFRMNMMMMMFGRRKVSPKSPGRHVKQPRGEISTNLPQGSLRWCPPTPACLLPQASLSLCLWLLRTFLRPPDQGHRRHQGGGQGLRAPCRPLWQGWLERNELLGQETPNLRLQAKIEPFPPDQLNLCYNMLVWTACGFPYHWVCLFK